MDSATFRQIVAAHREAVFATIARLTGQPDAVENLALDVFAAAYRKPSLTEGWSVQLTRRAVEHSLKYLRSHPQRTDRLAALSLEQRAAFVLQYVENRSEDEVCAILRISAAELRRTLEMAHRRLTAPETQSSPSFFLRLALGWKR